MNEGLPWRIVKGETHQKEGDLPIVLWVLCALLLAGCERETPEPAWQRVAPRSLSGEFYRFAPEIENARAFTFSGANVRCELVIHDNPRTGRTHLMARSAQGSGEATDAFKFSMRNELDARPEKSWESSDGIQRFRSRCFSRLGAFPFDAARLNSTPEHLRQMILQLQAQRFS